MTTIIQKLKVATMMFLVVMVGVGVTANRKTRLMTSRGRYVSSTRPWPTILILSKNVS